MPKNPKIPPTFIVDGLRTPIGSSFRSLKDLSAVDLAVVVAKEIVRRNRIKKNLVDGLILGQAVSAGSGQNPARQVAILGELPVSVTAFTVNSVCGSGLQSVILAAQSIACADAQLIISGGMESASQCPELILPGPNGTQDIARPAESLVQDGLLCRLSLRHMGQLAEYAAKKFNISREDQDDYALQSHVKTCRAQEQKKFIPETIAVKLGGGQVFKGDERPRKNISLSALADLPPAFGKDGSVTAGNSSIPADGAAMVALASAGAVKKFNLKPKARILGYASIFVEPRLVFSAGIPAVKACLKKCGLSITDIDLFEVGEAFACQAILTQRALKIPDEKLNIWGGDIALGHPLGGAGTRILVTLLHALRDRKKKRGLAVICLGGGGAVAMAIERVS